MSETLQIPATWHWTSMGEIAVIVSGGTPHTDRAEFFGGTVPWITPSDLSGYKDKYISAGHRYLSDSGLQNSGAHLIPTGSVLFSSRAPIGYVAIAANPVATNQGFKTFVLHSGISSDYVYYYLQHAKNRALELASGTTFPELSARKAAQIPIPVAPAREQTRIVKEIEKHFTRLDAAETALRRVQDNLQRYRLAILTVACEGGLVPTEAEMARSECRDYEAADELVQNLVVGRRTRWENEQLSLMEGQGRLPLDNAWKAKYREPLLPQVSALAVLPDGWAWACIDQIATVDLGKELDKAKNQSGHYLPYLRNSNVRWGAVETDDVRSMFFDDTELERFSLLPGDLLVCEGGEPGRAAVWSGYKQDIMYQKAIHRVRFFGRFQPQYVALQLEFLAKTGNLAKNFTGSTIKHFTREAFLSLPIPVPPLAEQVRIVADVDRRLSVVDGLNTIITSNLQWSLRLRQSILQMAFTGMLAAQDPAEQRASELLKMIEREKRLSPVVKQSTRRDRTRIMQPKPVSNLTELLERLDVLGGSAQAERILSEAGLVDDVDKFFELLREGRNVGSLLLAVGSPDMISRRPKDAS